MLPEFAIIFLVFVILSVIVTCGIVIQKRQDRDLMRDRQNWLNRWQPTRVVGISKEQRQKLSKIAFDPSLFSSEDAQCTICLIDYASDSELVQLQCHHIFHHACVDEWLSEHKTCPVCRLNVFSPSISDSHGSDDAISNDESSLEMTPNNNSAMATGDSSDSVSGYSDEVSLISRSASTSRLDSSESFRSNGQANEPKHLLYSEPPSEMMFYRRPLSDLGHMKRSFSFDFRLKESSAQDYSADQTQSNQNFSGIRTLPHAKSFSELQV